MNDETATLHALRYAVVEMLGDEGRHRGDAWLREILLQIHLPKTDYNDQDAKLITEKLERLYADAERKLR